MPSWLAWLLPIPVAALLAIAWTAWRGRSRGPVDPAESVRAHQRFVAALAAPVRSTPVPLRDELRRRAQAPPRT